MKSFKVLTLLTLAAALSCGANGSPTNVATDSFIKRQSKQELQNLVNLNSLQPIVNAANRAAKSNRDFTIAMVKGLWDNNNHYNYAICLVHQCDCAFDGIEGADWAQTQVVHNSASFDLVIGGAGTFVIHHDAGPNWTWKGSVQKGQNLNSEIVRFVKPGSSGAQLGGN